MKDPVPIVQEDGWAPGPVWTGAENLGSSGFRSPDRPARSQSLYRLRYPAHSLYRVSHEECARLRESLPYVKVYRYNPKHLYPKLNGYGDNGQRKVGASCGSKYCNLRQLIRHVTLLATLRGECSVHCACVTLCAVSHVTSPRGFLMYDMSASVFVVQFNGFMSLTS